jgi:hypothetical protein
MIFITPFQEKSFFIILGKLKAGSQKKISHQASLKTSNHLLIAHTEELVIFQ